MKEKMELKGKYDQRNKLNDLTGKEWLKLTKSFWYSEKSADDKAAFNHPAPFLIKDVEKLIKLFTKKGMNVLDPFCGSATTLIASYNLDRYGIGVDLNSGYKDLGVKRLSEKGARESTKGYENDFKYIIGDSNEIISKLTDIDYVVTSPPYHNILKNKGGGLRKINQKGYRNGARKGIEYYSEDVNDLGNKETYEEFLESLKQIMKQCYKVLNTGKYCTIIISDFTINKVEMCVQGDIVKLMKEINFEFVGTAVLLQDNKPLYPFGYPYAYKINHHHQNMIHFRKTKD
jgi:DNA modification methylase